MDGANEVMEQEYVLMQVHEEFAKRVEEENTRQNHRLKDLEEALSKITQLVTAVERLATNMEHLAKEQETQGKRLQTLEAKDGQKWQQVVSYVITALVSIAIGFIARSLGLQ